jgi:hypothetical protein
VIRGAGGAPQQQPLADVIFTSAHTDMTISEHGALVTKAGAGYRAAICQDYIMKQGVHYAEFESTSGGRVGVATHDFDVASGERPSGSSAGGWAYELRSI